MIADDEGGFLSEKSKDFEIKSCSFFSLLKFMLKFSRMRK